MNEKTPPNIVAWKGAEQLASAILELPEYVVLRGRIISLFREGDDGMAKLSRSNEIIDALPMLQNEDTRRSVINIVIKAVLSDEEFSACRQKHMRSHLNGVKPKAAAARRAHLREQGCFVFNEEENTYFWEIMRDDPSLKRKNGRYDHAKVAEKMNAKFSDREPKFTTKVCKNKFMTRRGVPNGHPLWRAPYPKKKSK